MIDFGYVEIFQNFNIFAITIKIIFYEAINFFIISVVIDLD
jgi:hypothetical protein